MLRITGGVLGGRRIAAPPGSGIRPTQQRVREALFSMLAERIPGCFFLDLFAGSGIVGMEAWSRGAAGVTLVEQDRRRAAAIREATETMIGPDAGLSPVRVMALNVERYLQRASALSMRAADIVFADPPYSDAAEWEPRLAKLLMAANLPQAGGVWVLEWNARNRPSAPAPWRVVDDRVYGETRLTTYRRLPDAGTQETDDGDKTGDLRGNL